MKILFVCENYLPNLGGVEVVFQNLAEGYVKKGHEVTILTHQLKGTPKEEIIRGVKVKRIHTFFSRYLFSFMAVPQALKLARQHDIIQTTTFNGAPPAWLAGKIMRKPTVMTVHEVWVGKWPQVTGFSWWKSKAHDLLEKLIYLLSFDHYVCVSEATKIDLLKRKVKESKVQVIHNGLDYDFWDRKKVEKKTIALIRRETKDNFICFCWGRPGESKGFEYLLRAVPQLKSALPNFQLWAMFSSIDKYPQKYQELLRLIQELHIENTVKVIPSVPDKELRDYLVSVDCVIVPSLAEGFGYTTVQTNALSVPIVISDAGSLPEVVSGKYQVFRSKDVVDLVDKVVKVSHGELLQRPQKFFLWEESINGYLDIYQKLLK